MKLAILIPGQLRTFNFCKPNFLQKIYQSNIQFDVFVDSYLTPGYSTLSTVVELFSGINVVSMNLENTVNLPSEILQVRKLLNCYENYNKYDVINRDHLSILEEHPLTQEYNYKPYDLVIRTRPDIWVHSDINYSEMVSVCKENKNVIFLGDTTYLNVGRYMNDCFAIGSVESMDYYFNRLYDYHPSKGGVHGSLAALQETKGIVFYDTITTEIIR